MLSLPRDDDTLDALAGVDVASERSRAIAYRPLKQLGEGGTAIAFLALRVAPDGECPVVLKIMRPSMVRKLGDKAALATLKEAVSLGRLNEQVPPTPFVVRLIDAGTLHATHGARPLSLPWVVVEHVHGGPEGTTLDERVRHSLRLTGEAFDPARAARALRCITAGLDAVHEAGVIHRDMKPENVLCCGRAEEELFKVADFGIARPLGVDATFGFVVGTPGYGAPELVGLEAGAVGPWTDVFGLAAIIYFMLTGEDYFASSTTLLSMATAALAPRPSLLDARALSSELRSRPAACRAIDAALARATAPDPAQRTRTAAAFRAEIEPHLGADSRRARSSRRRDHQFEEEVTTESGWAWSVLHRPSRDMGIRDVGWDADGRCLAATEQGLSFWDGTTWRDAPVHGLPLSRGLRFVRRTAPGEWLIGGDQGTFATYDSGGVRDVVRGDPSTRFELMSGDLDDMAVLAGTAPAGTPTLLVLVAHRWMKPFPIFDAAALRAIARIDDARWLLAGKGTDGSAYTGIFAPLDREIVRLPHGGASDLVAAAAAAHLALAAGSGGAVLWWSNGTPLFERVSPGQDLSAVALDPQGSGWAAGRGRIWLRHRRAEGQGRWSPAWEDPNWHSPIVSLFADIGHVLAVTTDGAVIEGKSVTLPT